MGYWLHRHYADINTPPVQDAGKPGAVIGCRQRRFGAIENLPHLLRAISPIPMYVKHTIEAFERHPEKFRYLKCAIA
jgi:hypothetical protein